ncbi:MAG TPA: hypothetical protein VFC00_28870 [Micromonosporaceae bacterium]|nr:hypothetical protein [Micromonosporaceae bacterium]
MRSADDVVRERFAAWCERRAAAPLRGFGTDLPLMAAMIRLAVGGGGDHLSHRDSLDGRERRR